MFQEFLEKNNIEAKKIAVAVSGGADSLALMLMLQDELAPLGYQIYALTVDHQLRPTSSKEAAYVQKIAKEHHIEHHTLIWKDTKPETGIEEAARDARYALLEDWCLKNGVFHLLTAHHLYDQAETFLMRLARGSGLDGLCAMTEVSKRGQIFILRPLLWTDPKTLKQYLKKKNISWIEDESNEDESLLRVKIRHFLPELSKKTGITPLKLGQTTKRLQTSKNYIETKVQSLLKNNFKKLSNEIYSCSLSFFKSQDIEMRYRLISFLTKQIAQLTYPPEAEKILNLLDKIDFENFKSATLGHTLIIRHRDLLWFCPEVKTSQNLSKKQWEDYLDEHPKLKKQPLPLAVKKTLFFL